MSIRADFCTGLIAKSCSKLAAAMHAGVPWASGLPNSIRDGLLVLIAPGGECFVLIFPAE
jgi:hypothetical protein